MASRWRWAQVRPVIAHTIAGRHAQRSTLATDSAGEKKRNFLEVAADIMGECSDSLLRTMTVAIKLTMTSKRETMPHQHSTLTSFPQCDCVVLVSGGVDSAACVDFYERQRLAVSGLHVTYGQPAARHEAAAATAIAHYYGIPLTLIRLVGARPKSDGELLGRNALLLFTALMELDARSAILALGVHSGTPYYDCSSSFLATVQSIVDGQSDGRIRVVAPFLEWTKKEIWDYCLEHRVPIDLTYSCERGLDHPCGVCLSCRDLEALRACQKLHNSA